MGSAAGHLGYVYWNSDGVSCGSHEPSLGTPNRTLRLFVDAWVEPQGPGARHSCEIESQSVAMGREQTHLEREIGDAVGDA